VPLSFAIHNWDGDEVTLALTAHPETVGLDHIIYSLNYEASDLEYLGMERADAIADWGYMDNPTTPGITHGIVHRNAGEQSLASTSETVLFRFRLAAGTSKTEVFFSRLAANDHLLDVGTLSIDRTSALPRAYAMTNHPNPFNPYTKVLFDIPSGANQVSVNLQIYDISGRLVRTLLQGSREPGRHEVIWNGKDNRGAQVGAGIYFIRIRAGEWVHTRKVALIK
jgi:hypothetical protein